MEHDPGFPCTRFWVPGFWDSGILGFCCMWDGVAELAHVGQLLRGHTLASWPWIWPLDSGFWTLDSGFWTPDSQ